MQLQSKHWTYAAELSVACLITWYISQVLFYGLINAHSALLGSMWAVVSTIFVLKETHADSISAGIVRIAATVSSVALCSIYFFILPFHPVPMVLLIALGYLVANAVGRPEDAVTTGITITVVMVIGGIEPATASTEPLLRLADTLIGSAVAIAAAWTARFFGREQKTTAAG
jgi:uncharacterized membrane protein YccC